MHVFPCKKVGVPLKWHSYFYVLWCPFLLFLCSVITLLLFPLGFIYVRFQSVFSVFLPSLLLQISLFFMSFCPLFRYKSIYSFCLSVLSFAVNQSVLYVFLSFLPLQNNLFFMSFCLSFYYKSICSVCLLRLVSLLYLPCPPV